MDVSKNEVHPKTKQKTPRVNMVVLSVETDGFFGGKASMSYSEPMVGWSPFLIRDSRIGYQLYMYYCVYNN